MPGLEAPKENRREKRRERNREIRETWGMEEGTLSFQCFL